MGRMAQTLADIQVCKSLCREILDGEHFEVQNAVGFFDNLYQADLVLADLGLILHFFLEAQDKDMILEGQTQICIDGHHGLTQIKSNSARFFNLPHWFSIGAGLVEAAAHNKPPATWVITGSLPTQRFWQKIRSLPVRKSCKFVLVNLRLQQWLKVS